MASTEGKSGGKSSGKGRWKGLALVETVSSSVRRPQDVPLRSAPYPTASSGSSGRIFQQSRPEHGQSLDQVMMGQLEQLSCKELRDLLLGLSAEIAEEMSMINMPKTPPCGQYILRRWVDPEIMTGLRQHLAEMTSNLQEILMQTDTVDGLDIRSCPDGVLAWS